MPFNERGQAAIFVALLFNVLFVFFAMAINIASVVHDKINLQNSIDLASYYAASKQAELLNVIAHENYAIRQSYKILAWRYRTLGTMGLYRSTVHPVWSGDMSDSAFGPAVRPSLCVTYKPTWVEVPEGENLCNEVNLRIPPLPEVQVIAGFLGINAGIAALSRQLRAQFDIQCQKHGAYNWWFAMSILHAFRLDQCNRKQVIFALARNLSTENDFIDLDGNSVLQGA
ncbi:MAG: TadE/TadG family type IV pilus assembly protein, partial [Pseudobdellovibrionaceae bacterium]